MGRVARELTTTFPVKNEGNEWPNAEICVPIAPEGGTQWKVDNDIQIYPIRGNAPIPDTEFERVETTYTTTYSSKPQKAMS